MTDINDEKQEHPIVFLTGDLGAPSRISGDWPPRTRIRGELVRDRDKSAAMRVFVRAIQCHGQICAVLIGTINGYALYDLVSYDRSTDEHIAILAYGRKFTDPERLPPTRG